MNVSPIGNPLSGEGVVGVDPPLAPIVPAEWRRRLNCYSGRTLSDTALTEEQAERSGRLAVLGQRLSAGVVSGLEPALEQPAAGGDPLLHLTAGLGLAVSGEDVVLEQPVRVNLRDATTYATAAQLGKPPEEHGADGLQPRYLGPSLGDLLAANRPLPAAGVFLLQPVVAERAGFTDPRDPCAIDPQAGAFEDRQQVDGCRLLLYLWPAEWLPLPARDGRWRNRMAHAIFQAERKLGADEVLPWEAVGVPVGLVGFDDAWKPLFIDRHAVVRAGGKARRRSVLVAGAGDPLLWQARVQQFIEQLADTDLSQTPVNRIGQTFRFLPPAGLLPKQVLDLKGGRDLFFPSSYHVEAAPVPLEQLDEALEPCAPLGPIDLYEPDQVRVLVPVPQTWYEPALLEVEAVAQEFQDAVDDFVRQRADWLQRRQAVRNRATLLGMATAGKAPVYPPPQEEPDRVEDEATVPDPPFFPTTHLAHQSTAARGIHQHSFDLATPPFAVAAGDHLFTYVNLDPNNPPSEIMLQWNVGGSGEHRAYWGANNIALGTDGTNSRRLVGPLPPAGEWVKLEVPADQVGLVGGQVSGMAFLVVDGRATWAHSGKGNPEVAWVGDKLPAGAKPSGEAGAADWSWLEANGPINPPEGDFQTAIQNGARVVLPLVQLKAELAQGPAAGDVAQLDALGLEGFIRYLDGIIHESDDAIDLGFLRSQTDIYRIRQLMLGNTAGTRLATSPALAEIAQGDTALAAREDINTFLASAKGIPAAAAAAPAVAVAPSLVAEAAVAAPGPAAAAFSLTPLPVTRVVSPSVFIPKRTTTPVVSRLPVGVDTGALAAKAKLATAVSVSDLLQKQTSVVKSLPPVKLPTKEDITGETPLVGHAYDFRTVTVAERLAQPAANEAKSFTVASKYDAYTGLANLKINVGDIAVPGFLQKDAKGNPQEVTHTLGEIKAGTLANEILQGVHDPDPANADEAKFFSAGVRTLEQTIATLRLVEGRVEAYKRALASCQATLATLQDQSGLADQRLQVIEQQLDEARFNVATARALLAEEQARVDGINKRREQVLADHVPFLAFHRLRLGVALVESPTRSLDPGVAVSPVPTCLAQPAAAPPELRSMTELFREAPAQWFTRIPPLLDRLDRLDYLSNVLQAAKWRAAAPSILGGLTELDFGGGTLGPAIYNVFAAQRQVITPLRVQTAQLDLSTLVGGTWRIWRDQVQQVVSLGDLIDGGHGRADVARQAAQELNNITGVAACLYNQFGAVLPGIRLDWAQRLGEYQASVDLRNLTALPRWGEIATLQRRQMQGLVDWLFQQVDATQAAAANLMNDLVRVCVLVASHAPVSRIIAGAVVRPTTVGVGGRIDLTVDHTRVRVGMNVLVYSQNQVVAKGVVEDLGAGAATARVLSASRPSVALEAGARVHVAEPDGFARNPLMNGNGF